MTTTEGRPSTVLSVFAAVMSLTAFPLGFLVFILNMHDVADGLSAGGKPVFVALGCAVLATLVNAVGAFLLPRGALGVAAAGVVLTLMCGIAGAVGFRLNMNAGDAAIIDVNPADKWMLMHDVVGEASMAAVFGFSMAGALLFTLGLAALLGAAAGREQRAALGLFGGGALFLGLWQFAVAHQLGGEGDAYMAVAHGSPADRMVLIAYGLERAHHGHQFALVLLVPVLIFAVAGVMVLRGRPSMGAVVGGLAVPLVVLGALRVVVRPSADEMAMLKVPRITAPLRDLMGTPVDWTERMVLLDTKGLHGPDGTSLSSEHPASAYVEDGTLSIALAPDVTIEPLQAVLRQVAAERVQSVRLVGAHVTETRGFELSPPFDQLLTQARGVRVLLTNDETCDDEECEFGTISGDTLMVGSDSLPLADSSFMLDRGTPDFKHAIHLKLAGLTMEQLIKAAHTGAANDRPLALHLGEKSDGE